MAHIASIIHVTDLHLSVDSTGSPLDLRRQHLLARLKDQVKGPIENLLPTRTPPPTKVIVDLIGKIASDEAARCGAVVLVQTGDVEDAGFVPEVGFGGYRYLHEQIWPDLQDRGVTCVDVYGNHDIWPNSLPAPWNRQRHQELGELPAFATPWPDFVDVEATPLRLRFHRINTVRVDALGGFFAVGAVQPHPTDAPVTREATEQAANELMANLTRDDEVATLHFLVCHHPLHRFQPWAPNSIIGLVNGSDVVCNTALQDESAVVLAGHRHRFDPKHDPRGGASATVDVGEARQPPLPSGSGQLVAESATRAPRTGGGASISVYRIDHQHVDLTEGGRTPGEVSIDRLVHRTDLPADPDAPEYLGSRVTDPRVFGYDRRRPLLDHKVLHGLRIE